MEKNFELSVDDLVSVSGGDGTDGGTADAGRPIDRFETQTASGQVCLPPTKSESGGMTCSCFTPKK
jgi:hypothetical protein